MKYSIGDNVRHNNNTWVVIATKEDALTANYLDKLNGIIRVTGIREMAKKGIYVISGFDYVIKRIMSSDDGYSVLYEENVNCFEEDISH